MSSDVSEIFKRLAMPCRAGEADMSAFPKETPIAMMYVPYQKWEEPYDTETAFARGTIFPSLDKPFIGRGAV